MQVLRILNIADLAFMAAGVAVTLLMIVMGGLEERRSRDRSATPPGDNSAIRRQRHR